MLSISRSTLDCNCTPVLYLEQTFVVKTLYNYNILCYVNCSASQLPCSPIAMILYHIKARGGALTVVAKAACIISSLFHTVFLESKTSAYTFDVFCLTAHTYVTSVMLVS